MEKTLFNLNHAIMKKTYIVFAALAAIALFATSCVKDIEPAPSDMSRITASFPQDVDSKVSMDETTDGLELKWEEDDFLTVVGTTTETFTIESISEDGKTATFKGNPVEGDSFKVILSDLGMDYATRTLTNKQQWTDGTDTKSKLPYDAVLEDVADYRQISFTQEWADANGANLSQTGCLMAHFQAPEGCDKVTWVSLSTHDNVFSSSNAENSEKTFHLKAYFPAQQPDANGEMKVYFLTLMHRDVISAGEKVRLLVEGSSNGVFIKDVLLTEGMTIEPGKRNVIKVNRSNWVNTNAQSWNTTDEKSTWTAPYCNITYYADGPGRLIDGNNNNFWQLPWKGLGSAYGQGAIDQNFTAWDNPGHENAALVPMIGIINLGTVVENIHSIELIRRNANTKYVDIFVSRDTENDNVLGDHLKQNLLTNITNEMITGYWDEWDAKKWIKIGSTKDDFNANVKTFEVSGLGFKYIKVVAHSTDSNPVLALNELSYKVFRQK